MHPRHRRSVAKKRRSCPHVTGPRRGRRAHGQFPSEKSFRVADEAPTDVERALAESDAEILVCYLPVGSEKAVHAYAEACLATGVSLVNCVPVFVVSDPDWGRRFRDAVIGASLANNPSSVQ